MDNCRKQGREGQLYCYVCKCKRDSALHRCNSAVASGGENNSIAAFSLESLQAFPVSVSLHWAVARHAHIHIHTVDYICIYVCVYDSVLLCVAIYASHLEGVNKTNEA